MFEHCYFITGSNHTVIVVVPDDLPDAEIYNLSITPDHIIFNADYEPIAKVPYQDADVYQRFCEHSQVGMIAFNESEKAPMPRVITHVAYVETWGGGA